MPADELPPPPSGYSLMPDPPAGYSIVESSPVRANSFGDKKPALQRFYEKSPAKSVVDELTSRNWLADPTGMQNQITQLGKAAWSPIQGNLEEAAANMKSGNHVEVANQFLRAVQRVADPAGTMARDLGQSVAKDLSEDNLAGAAGTLSPFVLGAAAAKAPRVAIPQLNRAPKPYNAMEPGMRMPPAPSWTESLPVAGKFAKLYNIGAKVVNSSNEPRVVQVPGNPAPIPMDHPLARLKGEARSSGAPAPPVQPINGFGRLVEEASGRSSGQPRPPAQSVNGIGRLQDEAPVPEGRSSGMPAPPIKPTRSFRQKIAASEAANEEALSEPANVVNRLKALSEPESAPAQEMPPALQKFSEKFKAEPATEGEILNSYAAKARAPKMKDMIGVLRELGFTKRDWALMSEGQKRVVAQRAGYNFEGKISPTTDAGVAAGLDE